MNAPDLPALDIATVFRLASIDTWEQEQAVLAGRRCPNCGAPIAAGILALHRLCPAIPPALERALHRVTATRQKEAHYQRYYRLIRARTPEPR